MTVRLSAALTALATARLQLRASEPSLVAAVLDYQGRNRAHFRPWDPPLPSDFHTPGHQAERLRRGAEDFRTGAGFRWWLLPQDDPDRVIGSVHVSGVVRGPFQSAALGYTLDGALQGRGLMHEALQAVRAEVFSPRVNLHRLQAAWRPENRRSGAVLARLGFVSIGRARQYLYIDGAWRDHELAELVNPDFQPPRDW